MKTFPFSIGDEVSIADISDFGVGRIKKIYSGLYGKRGLDTMVSVVDSWDNVQVVEMRRLRKQKRGPATPRNGASNSNQHNRR